MSMQHTKAVRCECLESSDDFFSSEKEPMAETIKSLLKALIALFFGIFMIHHPLAANITHLK